MKYCQNCRTENTPDSLYCENCGYEFEKSLSIEKTNNSGPFVKKRDSNVKDTFLCILAIVGIIIAFIVISFIYSFFPDIIQLIIALVSLIIFLCCMLKIFLGLIEEIRERRGIKRRLREKNMEE